MKGNIAGANMMKIFPHKTIAWKMYISDFLLENHRYSNHLVINCHRTGSRWFVKGEGRIME